MKVQPDWFSLLPCGCRAKVICIFLPHILSHSMKTEEYIDLAAIKIRVNIFKILMVLNGTEGLKHPEAGRGLV